MKWFRRKPKMVGVVYRAMMPMGDPPPSANYPTIIEMHGHWPLLWEQQLDLVLTGGKP